MTTEEIMEKMEAHIEFLEQELKELGDTEYMKQYIQDSYYAYLWANDIGDKEYMINKFLNISEQLA